jgi:hypothetical protein
VRLFVAAWRQAAFAVWQVGAAFFGFGVAPQDQIH